MARRLTRLSCGPELGDIHDPGIEIPLFAGDPLIDLVGDDVRNTAPVLPRRRIAITGQLLLGKNVPKAELDPQPAIGLCSDSAGYQRLRVDLPPVAKPGFDIGRRDILDEALRVERPEQARAIKIGRDNPRDLLTGLAFIGAGACEGRDGDRHRLDLAVGDVDPQFGADGRGDAKQEGQRRRQRTSKNNVVPFHRMSFGLKSTTRSFQIAYLSGGRCSGRHRGLKKARLALSAAARKDGSLPRRA